MVIDFQQRVRGVDWIRIDARREERPAIADRAQPCVDGVDSGGRNRHESGLIELAAFDVAEDKRPVARDGSADAAAVLVLVHRQLRAGEGVRRVQAIVAKKCVAVRAPDVRAAARRDADVAAQRTPELRLSARGHDLKLVDRVDAERDTAQRGGVVVGRQAVDHEVVGQIALAADRHANARHGGGFREQLRAAADVRCGHARNQQREVEKVAAVQRKRVDFRSGHGPGDLTARRLEHRHVGVHLDRLVHAGHRECDRQIERGANGQIESSREGRKMRHTHVEVVRADAEVGKAKSPIAISHRRRQHVRVDLPRSHGRAGDWRAVLIDDASAQTGVVDGFLSHRAARCRKDRQHAHNDRHCSAHAMSFSRSDVAADAAN